MGSPSAHAIYTNLVTTRRVFTSSLEQAAAPSLAPPHYRVLKM
jgi:hypothetical protein